MEALLWLLVSAASCGAVVDIPDAPQVNLIGDNPPATLHGLPRFAGDNDLKRLLDEDSACQTAVCTDYAAGLIGLVGVGIFFIVLTFSASLIYCCARTCCKKRCCALKKGGYTKCQRYFPLAVMTMFALLVGVFCVIGYIANQDFSRGFSEDSTSVTRSTVTFLSDIDDLLLGVSSFMGTLRGIMLDQIGAIRDLVFEVSPTLQAGTDRIIEQMLYIEEEYDNRTVVSGGFEFPCDFCTNVSTRMGLMRMQIEDQTGSEFESFSETIGDLNTTFVDAEAEITGAIQDAQDGISDVQLEIEEQSEGVSSQIENVENYDSQRKLAINILFVFPLLSLLAVIFGLILRKDWIFGCNFALGELTAFIMWLLFATHAPLAAFVADTCIALDEIEAEGWAVGSFSGNQTAVLAGCMNDVSLAESFGVTDQLKFTDAVEFPTVDLDAEALFNFSEMNSFTEETATLNTSTFGGRVDGQLELIEDVSGTLFTRENLNGSYNPIVPAEIELKNVTVHMIVAEANAIAEFESIIASMQNDTNHLMSIANDTKRLFSETIAEMNQLEDLLDPIFDQVADLDDVTSCSFLPTLYDNLKGSICFTMLGGLGSIVFVAFLIGIFMIPLLIISIVLSRRLSRPETPESKHKRLDSDSGQSAATSSTTTFGSTAPVQARVIR